MGGWGGVCVCVGVFMCVCVCVCACMLCACDFTSPASARNVSDTCFLDY